MKSFGLDTANIWQNGKLQWIIFFLAVLLKSLLLRTYLQLDGDRALQVSAAIEMAKGSGYTIPQVTLDNLNLAQSAWLLEWPPLYSALLAPLLLVTYFDLGLSSIILETAAAFFYLLAIWRLAAYLRFPIVLQMLILGFKATEAYEGLIYSFATDFHAAACLLWALYYFLQYLEKSQWKLLVTTTVCLIAAFLFRYAYLPAVFLFPIMLAWNGWRKKDRTWLKASFLLLTSLTLALVVYLSYNKLRAGSFTYLGEWQKGFYPWKLAYILPLFWQAITHVTFICVQAEQQLGILFRHSARIAQWSSHLLILFMLVRWLSSNTAQGFTFTESRGQRFFLSSGIISLMILVILAVLTLRIDIYHGDDSGGGWSYLVEDRYFLVPLTVVLFAIVYSLYKIKWQIPRLQQILRAALLLAFCFQLLHTTWIIFRRLPIALADHPEKPAMAELRWNSLDKLFQQGRNAGNDLVLMTRDYGAAYWALQNDVKIFRYIGNLQDSTGLKISQPTTVILILPEYEVKKLKGFLNRYQFQPKRLIAGEIQFIAHLKPAHP